MKRILISIMVPFLFLFILFLVYNSVIERRYIESINTICNTDDLSLITDEIYNIGDYNSDSDLIKEIEKNSNWKFQEIYFDDGERAIIFKLSEGEKLFELKIWGKSNFLSQKYKQRTVQIQIRKNEELLYSSFLDDNLFVEDYSHRSELDDVKYYNAMSNEKLKEFINVYKKAVTDTYCI